MIRPIDGTLISNINLDQSGPESNGDEGVFHIPQTPGLDPHHQMQFSVIPRKCLCLSMCVCMYVCLCACART